MVIGLMAAVGVTTPTVMVAPLFPDDAGFVLGALELPQAARMAPSNGNDSPTAEPRRRKSRLDRRPATNSSMTCSWIGPRPLRRSSSRPWSISMRPLLSATARSSGFLAAVLLLFLSSFSAGRAIERNYAPSGDRI